jgi:hypothetical protein
MKMGAVLLVIVFTFAIQCKVTLEDENRVGLVWNEVVALVSIILWSGLGIGGRWIGFS